MNALTLPANDTALWHAVRCAARREIQAESALKDIGVEVYLPCELRIVRHARTTSTKRSPLLPGYLFARFDLDDLWRVNQADGVYSVIGNSRGPSPVPPAWVRELQALEAAGEFDKTQPKARAPLVDGQRVVITGSVWQGRKGIVERRGKKLVRVLLDALNGSCGRWPVELKVDQVEADPSPAEAA